jgi:hypothetical protein
MSRRASDLTQAEIRRLVAGAKQAGASEVVVRRGGTVLEIKLSPTSTVPALEQTEEIVL